MYEDEVLNENYDADDWSSAENDALEVISEGTPTETDEESEMIDENENRIEDTEEEKEETSTPTVSDEIEVVYNSEKKKVTREEAIPLIQKGMNYDKLKNMYDTDASRNFIKQLADRENMSVDEYIRITNENIANNDIREIASKENVTLDVAKELYNSRNAKNQMLANDKAKQMEDEANAKREKEFNDFMQAYPDVDAKDIPAKVWEAYANGTPLKYAYMEYENQNLKENNSQLKTNARNREQEITIGSSNVRTKAKEDWETVWDED